MNPTCQRSTSFERADARRRELIALLVILGAAALLRVVHFVGFGLGDDAYYAYTSSRVLREGYDVLNLSFGSNYRIGLWIPISLSFRCFGINDWSFVLFSWISSVLLVIVVYLLARQLFGARAAILAGAVQAVSTFDTAFASTMTIDIPTSFLVASSVLLFLMAESRSSRCSIALNGLAALCILWAYLIKLPAPVIVLVHGTHTLLHIRHWRKHASFYVAISVLFLATFVVDFFHSGDPFNYLHRELVTAPEPALFSKVVLQYPRWMYLPDVRTERFLFGPHFHVASIAVVTCIAIPRLRRASLLPLIWIGVQFSFLEFFPAGGQSPYHVIPRFFRYTYALVAPTSLLIGAALGLLWNALANRHASARLGPGVVLVLALGHSALSAKEGFAIARLYIDHFQDSRDAARLLELLLPAPIYSDFHMYDRFNFETEYLRREQPQWKVAGLNIQHDITRTNFLEPLRPITKGYVVMGGSRGVPVFAPWILKQGKFRPPDHWNLIAQFERPVDAMRPEPLRIYRVGVGSQGPPASGRIR